MLGCVYAIRVHALSSKYPIDKLVRVHWTMIRNEAAQVQRFTICDRAAETQADAHLSHRSVIG